MDVSSTKPTTEAASLIASSVQQTRFKERRQREAGTITRGDAVFFSPVIKVDPDTRAAILQYRNTETGEVENQYPSAKQIDSYKTAQALEKAEYFVPVVTEERLSVSKEPEPTDQKA